MAWSRTFCGFLLVVFARAADNEWEHPVQSECGHSLLTQATLLSRRSPPYPQEYLLDVDYIEDANNELLAQDLPNTSGGNGSNATGSNSSNSSNTSNTSNTSGNKTVAVVTETLPTGDLLQHCATRTPPEESVFYKTAPPGTPCIFGVDDRDEGAHCIIDDMKQTGSLGWCWTQDDKSEWGSCTESCPLFGQEAVLEEKVLQQQKEIEYWKELIAALANQSNETNQTNHSNFSSTNDTNGTNRSTNTSIRR
mmetsp:Transcript_25191/g.57946  ORF Transcript_25191/g.57946 Transcript_25191/m.57946 type:complete len:251 (+) Transcript_25191:123-875(+)